MRNHLVAIIAIFLLGCSTKIPMNQDDICVIIDENPRWSNSLLDAKKKWNAFHFFFASKSELLHLGFSSMMTQISSWFIGIFVEHPNKKIAIMATKWFLIFLKMVWYFLQLLFQSPNPMLFYVLIQGSLLK